MKAIKENWKLVLIVAAGIIAVIFMCIFGVQGAQNKDVRKLHFYDTSSHRTR